MKFTKTKPNNEISEFNAKFKNTGKTYGFTTDGINITEVRTDDKEIIKWLKEHGFKYEIQS